MESKAAPPGKLLLPAGMPLVVAMVEPNQPVVPFKKRISLPVAFGFPLKMLKDFQAWLKMELMQIKKVKNQKLLLNETDNMAKF